MTVQITNYQKGQLSALWDGGLDAVSLSSVNDGINRAIVAARVNQSLLATYNDLVSQVEQATNSSLFPAAQIAELQRAVYHIYNLSTATFRQPSFADPDA